MSCATEGTEAVRGMFHAGLLRHIRSRVRDSEAARAVEIDGCSQVDIACANGLAISAVKSRVQRGRGLLKQMLLDCCHIERDWRGGIVSYARRGDCYEAETRRRRGKPRRARA